MSIRNLTLTVMAFLTTFVLSVSTASASETHLFEASFGPGGAAATAFEGPRALDVDQSTGELYVADAEAGTVEKFTPAHEPEAFNPLAPNVNLEGKLTGFTSMGQIAVNSTTGNSTSHDFYVVNESGALSASLQAFHADGKPANFTAGPAAGTNQIAGFPRLVGVAVDATGDIYAATGEGGVEIFASDGEPVTTLPANASNPGQSSSVAVDAHGNVYLRAGSVEKLVPTEFPVTASTTYSSAGVIDANPSTALAVDPATNDLYVGEGTQVAQYSEGGVRLGSFGSRGPGVLTASEGVAVHGATGRVYVSDISGKHQVEIFGPSIVVPVVATGAPTEVKPTTVTLSGTVNPEGVEVTDCHFDYVDEAHYNSAAENPYAAGATIPCEQTVGKAPGEVAVTARPTGLHTGTTYHFRLQATNTNGPEAVEFGHDETFATPPPPAITNAVASNLSAFSVDLGADVNPGGLQVKTCEFEYGTAVGVYSHSVECVPGPVQIGSGTSPVPVTQHVPGLKPNITYHWRVVASSEAGTTTGADHSFIYLKAVNGLPDGRSYEMVTPPQKNGALVGPTLPFSARTAISADGSRVLANTVQCFDGAGSCPPAAGAAVGVPYAFTRIPGAWTLASLAPPASEFETEITWDFSADLGTAVFVMPNPVYGERDIYAREEYGSFVDVGPITPRGGGPTTATQLRNIHLSAATGDLSHVLFDSGTESESPAPFPPRSTEQTLYEYVGAGSSRPSMVGVSGGFGSTELISDCATQLGGSKVALEKTALSADGRIAYFTAGGCAEIKKIYARVENGEAGAHTVAVSEPQALEPGLRPECAEAECIKNTERPAPPATNPSWRDAEYQGASSDGSRVFFTSAQQLTDQASQGSGNLYEFEGAGAPEPSERRLVDVSVCGGCAGGPRVQGVVAFSRDGSHVYFVAQGVLTGAARPGCKAEWETAGITGPAAEEHCKAQDGAENLYVYDLGSHSVAFLTVLPERDSNEWQEAGRPANVTPDGRFLVFTSSGSLTADDSRTNGAQQVFRYDEQTGALVRVSIGQEGFNDHGNAGAGDASIVEGTVGYQPLGVGRPDPSMSDDGSYVFFMSPLALTAGALNDVQIGTVEISGKQVPAYAENVYEYHEGNVSVISDGRDTNPSVSVVGLRSSVELLGSDTSGHNVFFTTADQLVPKDTDTGLDIYDARICEPEAGEPCITEPLPPLPPCLGEACHGIPPERSSLLTGGSETFSGAGNLAPPTPKITKKTVKCKKPKKLSHNKCVRPRSKKHKAKRSAHTNRRAK
jgi:hypothetical protein